MDPKPYLVIARKYRPQTFDDVIGQEPIVTTLKNAISLKKIGHAYLFTGSRGVGKTSMARIFAKALNCKSGPTLNPCSECTACTEIENSRSLDVLEIDGASNRSIDDIRTLRENVKFAPAMGKFKVYIIDEVHQITHDGFNALLKTLEEPPAHVKFIFATTAAHKVPVTILSRCQRFDFRRIPAGAIVESLKEICKKEKIKADDDALLAIAKAADGGLRDSQTILEHIAATAKDKICLENVTAAIGSLEEESVLELVDAIAKHDAKAALLLLDRAMSEGKDPLLFMEKFLEHTRNLLFVKVSEDLMELIEATESYKKALSKQKELFTRDDLFYFFSVIMHAIRTVQRFELKRIPIEMALIKLAGVERYEEISKLLSACPVAPRAVAPRRENDGEEDLKVQEFEELPEGEVQSVGPGGPSASLESVWGSLIHGLKGIKMSVATYLAEGQPISLSNGVIKVAFPENLAFHRESLETQENRGLIEKHLQALLQQPVRVEFQSVKDGESPVSAPREPSPEVEGALKTAMNLFGGRLMQS